MVTKRLYTWFLLKSYSDFPGKLLPDSLGWKSHHRKHTLHNANYLCFDQCEANDFFGKCNWRNSFSSHMFDTSSKRTVCKLQKLLQHVQIRYENHSTFLSSHLQPKSNTSPTENTFWVKQAVELKNIQICITFHSVVSFSRTEQCHNPYSQS